MKNLSYLKIPFTSKKIYFSPKAKAKHCENILASPNIRSIDELAHQRKSRENEYDEVPKAGSSHALASLEESLVLRVFSHLPAEDVDHLMRVNKKFNKLIRKRSFNLAKHFVRDVEICRSAGGLVRFREISRTKKTHHIYTNISGLRRYFARIEIGSLFLSGKICDVLLNVLSKVKVRRFLAKQGHISASYASLSNFFSTSNVQYVNFSDCSFGDFQSICNQLFIDNPQLDCVKISTSQERLSFPFLTDRIFFELSKSASLPSQLILENVETGISIRGIQILINSFRSNPPSRPLSYLLGRISTNRTESIEQLSPIQDITLFQIHRCKLGVHAAFGSEISIVFATNLPRRRLDLDRRTANSGHAEKQ